MADYTRGNAGVRPAGARRTVQPNRWCSAGAPYVGGSIILNRSNSPFSISQFDYNASTGRLSNERIRARFSSQNTAALAYTGSTLLRFRGTATRLSYPVNAGGSLGSAFSIRGIGSENITAATYDSSTDTLIVGDPGTVGFSTIILYDYDPATRTASNRRVMRGASVSPIRSLAFDSANSRLLVTTNTPRQVVSHPLDLSTGASGEGTIIIDGIPKGPQGGLLTQGRVIVLTANTSSDFAVYDYVYNGVSPPESIDITESVTTLKARAHRATAMDTVAVSESVSVGVVRAKRGTATDTIPVSDMATRTHTHVRRAREMPFLSARAQLTGTLSGGNRGPEAATVIGNKIIASLSNQVWDYDYDPDTATVSNPRQLLSSAALRNTVSFERFVTGMTHLPNGNVLMTDRSYGRLLEVTYDPVRGMSRPAQPRSTIHSMLRISDITEEGITVSPSGRRVIILDGRSNVLYDAVYSAGVLSRGRTLGPVGAGSHGVLYHPPSGLLLVTYVTAASIRSFTYDEDAGTIVPDNSLSAATGGTPTGLGYHAGSGRIVCVRNDRRADHYAYVDPAPMITDMATATYRRIRRLSDSIGVAGVATGVRGRARRAMDRITISDMAEGLAQGLARVSDSIDISGVATRLRRSRRTASDDTAITDEATAKLRATRTAEDSISIRESVSVVIQGLVDVAESIPVSDMATAAYARLRTASDSIDISEMARRATGKARQAADTAVRITDAAKARISGVSAAEEHVDVTDSATASRRATRTAGDSITISDIADTMLGGLARAADTIHITDMATRMISAVRTAGDSITTSESASTTKVREHSVQVGETESIPVTDSAIRRLNAARRVTDQIHISDMATVLRRIRRSVSDAVHITDHAVTDRFRTVNRTVAKLGADLRTTTLRIPSSLNRTSIINISKLVPEKLRLVRKAT